MIDLELLPAPDERPDRLEQRRRSMRRQILEVSLQVMREEGVGGLSLAEVARRIGVKPPSLYKHVASKQAVYDALFEAGTRAHAASNEAAVEGRIGLDALTVGFEASVRWCVEHPTLTQLLYWRPVPGYEPSPEAFVASQRSNERARWLLASAVERGELREDATSDAAMALFTCLLSGVITQQLANEPGVAFEEGRFTRHAGEAFGLFVCRYGTPAAQAAGHGNDRGGS